MWTLQNMDFVELLVWNTNLVQAWIGFFKNECSTNSGNSARDDESKLSETGETFDRSNPVKIYPIDFVTLKLDDQYGKWGSTHLGWVGLD